MSGDMKRMVALQAIVSAATIALVLVATHLTVALEALEDE